MRFHETWREEIGWIITLIGIGGLIFGIVDLPLGDFGLLSPGKDWLFIFGGGAATLIGLWLHITRSRRRKDIDVPPRDAGQAQSSQQQQQQPPQTTG